MREFLRQFSGKEHGPLVQFIKYGIAGGVATSVHIVVFSLMAALVLPALSERDYVVSLFQLSAPVLTDGVRAQRAAIDNAVAFLFSNMAAYLINIFWVFTRGRHHWVVEILFFYAVSAVSLVIGTVVQTWLIQHHGMTTTMAFGANIVSALLINFAMRKFVIFKG